MDLVRLRYFVRVAQLKSFTRASAALHITQPALTRQVLLLEDELGVQLLHRHRRGAEPTEAGLRLLAGADSVFRLLQQVSAEVSESGHQVRGVLRLGFPPSFGGYVISGAIATFLRRHPQATLELHEGLTHELRDRLLSDRLDLAVVAAEGTPLLESTHLCDEDLWVLLPPVPGRARKRKAYTLQELAGYPLIQPGRWQWVRQYIDSEAARQGVVLNVAVQADALQTTRELVRRGVGAHISPFSGIGADIERGDFAGGPVAGLWLSRYLARRVDRPVTLAMRRFQETLVETLAQLQASHAAIRLPAPA